MPSFDVIFSAFAFAAAAGWTPGPNTLMVATSGANFGVKRTLPHMIGVAIGVVSLVALGVGGLSALVTGTPIVFALLQLGGAGYLFYMSYRIATAGAAAQQDQAKPLTIFEGAAFQFANPKAWTVTLSGSAVFMGSLQDGPTVLLVLGAAFIFACFTGLPVWAAAGRLVSELLTSQMRLRIFNVTMGVLLAVSIASLLDYGLIASALGLV